MRIMELEGMEIREQYIRSYQLRAFLAAFPAFSFFYVSSMPKINIINYNTEGKTEVYAFAPSMFGESFLAGNQLVFENLYVIQIGINKTDSQWNNWLIIWWGDQKTEAQMLRI